MVGEKMFWIGGLSGLAVVSLVLACSKGGTTRWDSVNKRTTISQNTGGEGFDGLAVSIPIELRGVEKSAWAVTSNRVYRVTLDEAKGYPVREWSKLENWGNRSYVSELGLVIGQSAREGKGGILLATDKTEEAVRLVTDAQLGMITESRICVTSYRVGEQIFIGGGYTHQDGSRRFVRIPVDRSKPNGVNLANMEILNAGSDGDWWGYACYVDQANLRYWSAHGVGVFGFDLQSNLPLTSTQMPNASVNLAVSNFTIAPTTRGTYALSGDAAGNILNVQTPPSAPGVEGWKTSYTFAHEPISNLVFGSSRVGLLYLTASDCFAAGATSCPDGSKHFAFDVKEYGEVGPLSSLSDGTVVGVARGERSIVYVISLKQPGNPAAGVLFKKVAEVAGDAYMYTDFTGATLYAVTNEKFIDLRNETGYNPKLPISRLQMKWNAEGDHEGVAWQGLKMSIRCVSQAKNTDMAFAAVANVQPSGTVFVPEVEGCKAGDFDTIWVRVEGDSSTNAFSHVKDVYFSLDQ